MKKNRAFTLAELLIVLGITGVVAAVLLPAINNLMPDKTKVMYLKAYDELSQDIKNLASNSSLFFSTQEAGDKDFVINQYPLLNTQAPRDSKFSEYSGKTKLCKLIAYTLNSDADNKCSDESYEFNSSDFKNKFNSNAFTTANGMKWWIVPLKNEISSGDNKASYQTDIYVDVDPSKKSPDCIYDANSCKNPDRFKFMLSADGTIIAADPMGRFYLRTRKNWLKTKGDLDDGGLIAALDLSLLEVGLKEAVEPSKPEEPPTPEPEPEPTPEPEPEPEPSVPEFDPTSVRATISLTPLKLWVTNRVNGYPDTKMAFGVFVTLRINKPIQYNVKGGVSLKYAVGGYENYRCTIPAGKTACVSRVLNPWRLKFNSTGWSISSTNAWIEGSDYSGTISNVTTQNMQVQSSESYFHSSAGYTFSIDMSDPLDKNSDLHKMAVLSGKYTPGYNTPSDYYGYSEGQKWFFNDVDPELLTGRTDFPNGEYEIVEFGKVKNPEYYE